MVKMRSMVRGKFNEPSVCLIFNVRQVTWINQNDHVRISFLPKRPESRRETERPMAITINGNDGQRKVDVDGRKLGSRGKEIDSKSDYVAIHTA
jgi:hypothetical protein